jgi:hypothetical protein
MIIRDREERVRRRRAVKLTVHHATGGLAVLCFLTIPIVAFFHSAQAGASAIGVVVSALAFNHAESALRARREREEGVR